MRVRVSCACKKKKIISTYFIFKKKFYLCEKITVIKMKLPYQIRFVDPIFVLSSPRGVLYVGSTLESVYSYCFLNGISRASVKIHKTLKNDV